MNTTVSWLGLAVSLLLVAIAAGISWWQRLGLQRQWLHARTLGFEHPADGRWIEFTSPYPADLDRALDLLRAM